MRAIADEHVTASATADECGVAAQGDAMSELAGRNGPGRKRWARSPNAGRFLKRRDGYVDGGSEHGIASEGDSDSAPLHRTGLCRYQDGLLAPCAGASGEKIGPP